MTAVTQLTVLSRSAIVVKSKFSVAFFCFVALLFGLFCGCRGFCHRTESDIFLFLFKWYSFSFLLFFLSIHQLVHDVTSWYYEICMYNITTIIIFTIDREQWLSGYAFRLRSKGFGVWVLVSPLQCERFGIFCFCRDIQCKWFKVKAI